jgi:hypothetical protein
MSDYTSAELEEVLAKASGREPRLEKTGSVMGLPIQTSDTAHPFEAGMRMMALDAATESARRFVLLAQAREGLSREAAEDLADSVCTTAYEEASRETPYESERYDEVLKAIEGKLDGYKQRVPLVTESQTAAIKAAAENWTPERILMSKGHANTGRHEAPSIDEQILNALEGR